MTAQPQVRSQLCDVDWQDVFDCFDLENKDLIDQLVDPVGCVDAMFLKDDRHFHLPLHAVVPARQLQGEAFIVHGLEKPWTKLLMNANRGSDHGGRELVVLEHGPLSSRLRRRMSSKACDE